ncbi:hypothetical protein QJQ45_015155, partial [Haematococcus lacustris]
YLGNKFGGNQNWMVAAMNDGHPRFGGSCGRCYKIRCKPMTVRDNYGQQIDRNHECYNQDPVTVVITDNCPCHYPNNAYSNKRWCCGDMDHFDLGIWAFKKFADPGKGVVGIEYHETPCPADFQQPLNPSVQKPRCTALFAHKYDCVSLPSGVGKISIMADTQDGGYLGNKFGGNQNWMVAAMNDGHPRFGGSCGRCYKIRCKPMTVRDNYGQQIDRNHECYNQDPVTVVITDNW